MNANVIPGISKGVDRFDRPGPIAFIAWMVALALVVWSFSGADLSIEKLVRGVPYMGNILERMFPPDLSRLESILASLAVTFQMAVSGCILGLVLSFPLAILAADGLSPHPLVRAAARGLIAFFRTVPDLVWALFFVIAVGLGPAAGVLALMVDTIGYAGRFFAEAMEETDKGPREALSTIGATRTGLVFSAVVPNAMPSFIATALFCLEKATRASVVLGLVGAGGIGVELKVAFDLFDYDTAATIIIVVFILVVAVEQIGAHLRRRILWSVGPQSGCGAPTGLPPRRTRDPIQLRGSQCDVSRELPHDPVEPVVDEEIQFSPAGF